MLFPQAPFIFPLFTPYYYEVSEDLFFALSPRYTTGGLQKGVFVSPYALKHSWYFRRLVFHHPLPIGGKDFLVKLFHVFGVPDSHDVNEWTSNVWLQWTCDGGGVSCEMAASEVSVARPWRGVRVCVRGAARAREGAWVPTCPRPIVVCFTKSVCFFSHNIHIFFKFRIPIYSKILLCFQNWIFHIPK